MLSSVKTPPNFELLMELPPSTITVPADAEYEIAGVTQNGTFDIAVRYIGDERPPADILPSAIYEELVEKLRNRVDLAKVEQASSDENWPKIGTCRLQRITDRDLVLSVSLAEKWIDEGDLEP